MQGCGGDSTLVRYQLVRFSLGFLSFSCHKISGNETTDNRMCLMFCDLNAGLMGIKENWVQVGHKASNQPREKKRLYHWAETFRSSKANLPPICTAQSKVGQGILILSDCRQYVGALYK